MKIATPTFLLFGCMVFAQLNVLAQETTEPTPSETTTTKAAFAPSSSSRAVELLSRTLERFRGAQAYSTRASLQTVVAGQSPKRVLITLAMRRPNQFRVGLLDGTPALQMVSDGKQNWMARADIPRHYANEATTPETTLAQLSPRGVQTWAAKFWTGDAARELSDAVLSWRETSNSEGERVQIVAASWPAVAGKNVKFQISAEGALQEARVTSTQKGVVSLRTETYRETRWDDAVAPEQFVFAVPQNGIAVAVLPKPQPPKTRVAKAPAPRAPIRGDGIVILQGGGTASLGPRRNGGNARSSGAITTDRRRPSGPMPPAFNTLDSDGRVINLNQYRGKVTLIDFWASWCPPCRAEMPEVVSVYRR